jgi:hypothetical protein
MLPRCLLESHDFLDLNEKQHRDVLARLSYLKEILNDAQAFGKDGDTHFLDDAELDVLSILSIRETSDDAVSVWLINSMWPLQASRHSMLAVTRPYLSQILDCPQPGLTSTLPQVQAWILLWAQVVNIGLEKLEVATEFDEALAHLMGLHALMASLLTVCMVGRLNHNLNY